MVVVTTSETTLWQPCDNVIRPRDQNLTKTQRCYNVVCQLGKNSLIWTSFKFILTLSNLFANLESSITHFKRFYRDFSLSICWLFPMFLQRTLYVLIFSWINDFELVLNHGGCLSSHAINSWDIRPGRMNFKIKFCVWGHFRCSEGWVLESTIKLSWDVKSMHEDEFSRIWVG